MQPLDINLLRLVKFNECKILEHPQTISNFDGMVRSVNVKSYWVGGWQYKVHAQGWIGIEISIEIGIGIAFDEAAPRAQSDKKRKTLSHKQKTFDFDSGK